ncbi:phosphoacetylglucosamine mutase [Anopheles ziemanni]|uniref:phosphoacetylglucosamine mutase n=1 Tax=Anopheles coustani TaxID=139045 RepID=UPI00265A9C44|nr:phosphoacetylglucosamine mutase [Anopheles coustani]XP_058171241.1 phosphoacetylglucosamine mutase [Anopheles ziemanni]
MSVNLRSVFAFAKEYHQKKESQKDIQYGTAGFRSHADNLDYVMYRMGVLAALRSRAKASQAIGVMITASHNPEHDNGVKLIDPLGEMLEQRWEKLATDLVNVPDGELEAEVARICEQEKIDNNEQAKVFVGMDTRYHSPQLSRAVVNGVLALKGTVTEFGIVTTPMLHYFVTCTNTQNAYGLPTEEGYMNKLITAFKTLRGDSTENGNYKNQLFYDGANGVGSLKMLGFIKKLNGSLNVKVFNSNGKINFKCGADFVKTNHRVPEALPEDALPNGRCVSVDGDADRVVYYFTDSDGVFHLLDGDRIATLLAGYLKDLIEKCGVKLEMGLVQTAYANGASTDYIVNQMKIPVSCTRTGVKHLHHKALDYDIGVYFEANGHGTIIYSNKAKDAIRAASKDETISEEQRETAKRLLQMIDLTNETVGDAISDLLLVETVLHAKGWSLNDWLASYTDLPNLLEKVYLADRNVITVTDADRVVVTPEGLQDSINEIVAKFPKGRSFVRPSGTEDIVRVYAEADTRANAVQLAYEVANLVFDKAGGVGKRPEKMEI